MRQKPQPLNPEPQTLKSKPGQRCLLRANRAFHLPLPRASFAAQQYVSEHALGCLVDMCIHIHMSMCVYMFVCICIGDRGNWGVLRVMYIGISTHKHTHTRVCVCALVTATAESGFQSK